MPVSFTVGMNQVTIEGLVFPTEVSNVSAAPQKRAPLRRHVLSTWDSKIVYETRFIRAQHRLA